ncbi:MAG: IS110 family transposase [Dehalococcoidia bacterium]|nr:IS110 family transposase [Dehalococcoidia bacterium]
MQVVHPRCCGLDVHKKTVVACLMVQGADGSVTKETNTFGTMTQNLLALSDWLLAAGCTHVAMESTGSYWKPVWNILEGKFELVLVNAQHIKAVPGRKTDVKDCEWIAELLRHGLLRGSFVPDREQRELREVTRYRTSLIQERSAEVNRVQKTLEGGNIKLASVATDLMGRSGREILGALVAGTMDAQAMADLARGKLRQKLPQLMEALGGQMGDHQRFMLTQQLGHIDDLDETIALLDAEIEERMRPFAKLIERLDAIPGVGRRIAQVIIAEIGTDLSRFPTGAHVASWSGMCPGNNESAGKRHSGKTRKGNSALRVALIQAAKAAGHTRNSYLSAQYHRLAARRGANKAAVAVGHTILLIVHNLITNEDSFYKDLGVHYFDERDRERVQRRLVHRLEALGYTVSLEQVAA